MAFRLTLLVVLAGGPALAQYPHRQPPTVSSPIDTWMVPSTQGTIPIAAEQTKKNSDSPVGDQTPEEKETVERTKYVKLPAQNDVFAFPDDLALEAAILNRLRTEEGKRIDSTTKMPVNPFLKYPATLRFPQEPTVGGGIAYAPKTANYPPMRVHYEPLYVVHRRLHFEEKNAERYGWDLGIIQPFVSAAYFYKDVLLWPNSLASGVAYGFWDTNAGKCLPGSPTPYMLYPPGLTITGGVVEGLFVTGVAFAIP